MTRRRHPARQICRGHWISKDFCLLVTDPPVVAQIWELVCFCNRSGGGGGGYWNWFKAEVSPFAWPFSYGDKSLLELQTRHTHSQSQEEETAGKGQKRVVIGSSQWLLFTSYPQTTKNKQDYPLYQDDFSSKQQKIQLKEIFFKWGKIFTYQTWVWKVPGLIQWFSVIRYPYCCHFLAVPPTERLLFAGTAGLRDGTAACITVYTTAVRG